jgi:(p)ppGpp synthase/HD superfamily hydrolase
MSLLDQAIELAVTAHAGQTDEDGMPRVIHALEVMFGAKKAIETSRTYEGHSAQETPNYTGTVEDLMIAAVLHDTVEDSFVTLPLIEVQFGKHVRDMVDGVTRRGLGKGETKEFYRDFIYRAKTNPGSRIIKIADLMHNYGRSHKIKKASWRNKLMFKYNVALSVLKDADQPTWEQASSSVQLDGSHARYFIADPDGKRIEVAEEEFRRLYAKRPKNP